jgi:hypothetical protein
VIFLSRGVSSDSSHTSFTVDITGADNLPVPSSSAGMLKYLHQSYSAFSLFLASSIPSTSEIKIDTQELAVSIRKIFMLVLTSSAFRVLLQDVLVSARQVLTDTAVVVGRTAGQVQIAAEKVEHLVEPGHDVVPTRETFAAAIDEAERKSTDAFLGLQNEIAQETRAVIINRIQEVILSFFCPGTLIIERGLLDSVAGTQLA